MQLVVLRFKKNDFEHAQQKLLRGKFNEKSFQRNIGGCRQISDKRDNIVVQGSTFWLLLDRVLTLSPITFGLNTPLPLAR